jgi:hypothetical protein
VFRKLDEMVAEMEEQRLRWHHSHVATTHLQPLVTHDSFCE